MIKNKKGFRMTKNMFAIVSALAVTLISFLPEIINFLFPNSNPIDSENLLVLFKKLLMMLIEQLGKVVQ